MNKLRIAGITITVVAVSLLLITCLSSTPNVNPTRSVTPKNSDVVEYEITGTAETVDVTLSNSTGDIEQYSGVYVPRTFTYHNYTDDFVYISAQNNGESGTVIVRIYVNEKLLKSSSSSGGFVIATASGGK
jgi:hypothetical protein